MLVIVAGMEQVAVRELGKAGRPSSRRELILPHVNQDLIAVGLEGEGMVIRVLSTSRREGRGGRGALIPTVSQDLISVGLGMSGDGWK
ncbi:hypothetical protein [Belnapia moabensis]|uniref:hypothetical protein n=1 Tax=Belnapia moabensis TaxID=365533 RepID=UPI0012ED3E09|nr:hypothetical protein [Belnapia moabensis]